jgi:protein-S-isoprenylcysteine O-methyltransferase Ste14
VSRWLPQTCFIIGVIAMMIIRAPHGRRSGTVKIAESRKGRQEVLLLALMWIATLILPLMSIATPSLSFADYRPRPVTLLSGIVCLTLGLWLFYRSHADLGDNWSITLQLREEHRLITRGVYRRIRHPMYAAIFLQALAQALLLPNWLAGPVYLIAFLVMFALRIGPEERMMLEKFGDEYAAYRGRTTRLIPNVW